MDGLTDRSRGAADAACLISPFSCNLFPLLPSKASVSHMKRFLPVVFSLAFALCHVHGQYGAPKDDSDEKEQAPAPVEIPDFNNLDEYIYQPKSTLNYGLRFMEGPKVTFRGSGQVYAPEYVTDLNTPNIYRVYHDGAVDPDGRALTIGTGSGSGSVPVAADGKTNTWTFIDPTQLTSDDFMQMHIYSAYIPQISPDRINAKAGMGAELYNSIDMGRLGKHLKWSIFGGASISGINGANYLSENATLTTITDTYNLYGQTPAPLPVPGTTPYSSPSHTVDTLTLSGGGTETESVNSQTLISNTPVDRAVTSSSFFVTDHFKVSGEYFTVRGGPQVEYDFNDHLKAVVTVGPALIYAGTSFTTTELLQPPLGSPIIDVVSDGVSVFRLGAYADATLEYDLTETSGFYLGAFAQTARGYTEHIYDAYGSDYSSTVNLTDQTGLRTGMSFRF